MSPDEREEPTLEQLEALEDREYLQSRFLQNMAILSKSHKITTTQGRALRILLYYQKRGDKPIIQQVADRLMRKHNSTIDLLSTLEERHLIAREVDMVDNRRIYILLTEEGAQLAATLAIAVLDTFGAYGHLFEGSLSHIRQINDTRDIPSDGDED